MHNATAIQSSNESCARFILRLDGQWACQKMKEDKAKEVWGKEENNTKWAQKAVAYILSGFAQRIEAHGVWKVSDKIRSNGLVRHWCMFSMRMCVFVDGHVVVMQKELTISKHKLILCRLYVLREKRNRIKIHMRIRWYIQMQVRDEASQTEMKKWKFSF